MASWIRAVLTSTLLAFCIATPSARAAPAPIVFDFEDGLQGWELHGSATRVQTQLLGGQWAVLGDGFSQDDTTGLPLDVFMSQEIDLTGIGSVSLDQYFLAGEQEGLLVTPRFVVRGIDLIENIFIGVVELGFGPFDVSDPSTNPSVRTAPMMTFEGMRLEGVHRVEIHWSLLQPEIQRQIGEATPAPAIVAFIDNITFHPVPEPGMLALLALGLTALVIGRRRIT